MDLKQADNQSIRQFVGKIKKAFVNKYGSSDKDLVGFSEFRHRVMKNCLFEGMKPEIFEMMRDDIKNKKDSTEEDWRIIAEAAQDAEWLSTLHLRETPRVGTELSRFYNYQDFKVDDDGYVIVYIAGTSFKKKKPEYAIWGTDFVSGLGVWFGKDHYLNLSLPVYDEWGAATKIGAEMTAVIRALDIVIEYGIQRVAVYTDSRSLVNSVTKRIKNWLTNGWKTPGGETVRKKYLYRELLMSMENVDIKWVHVKSDGHHKENIEAACQMAIERASRAATTFLLHLRFVDSRPGLPEEQMDLKQGSKTIREFIREIDEAVVKKYGGKSMWGSDPEFTAMCRRIKKNCLVQGMNQDVFNMGMRIDVSDEKVDFPWRTVTEAAQDAEWLFSVYSEVKTSRNKTPPNNAQRFRVDDDGNVIVYTNGTCYDEGKPDAVAGIGVWFKDYHDLNVSEPIYGVQPVTEDVANMKAVIKALKIVKKHGVERVIVCTNSSSLTTLINKTLYYYLKNGWKMFEDDRWWETNDKPLQYKEKYRELLMCMEGLDVKWCFERHWQDSVKAEYLAGEGASCARVAGD